MTPRRDLRDRRSTAKGTSGTGVAPQPGTSGAAARGRREGHLRGVVGVVKGRFRVSCGARRGTAPITPTSLSEPPPSRLMRHQPTQQPASVPTPSASAAPPTTPPSQPPNTQKRCNHYWNACPLRRKPVASAHCRARDVAKVPFTALSIPKVPLRSATPVAEDALRGAATPTPPSPAPAALAAPAPPRPPPPGPAPAFRSPPNLRPTHPTPARSQRRDQNPARLSSSRRAGFRECRALRPDTNPETETPHRSATDTNSCNRIPACR